MKWKLIRMWMAFIGGIAMIFLSDCIVGTVGWIVVCSFQLSEIINDSLNRMKGLDL